MSKTIRASAEKIQRPMNKYFNRKKGKVATSTFCSIRGVVTPKAWDAKGNILDIYLAINGEKNIILENNAIFKELLSRPGSMVKLVGWKTKNRFIIRTYKELKPFSNLKIAN